MKKCSTSVALNSTSDERNFGADGGPSVRVYGEAEGGKCATPPL